MLIKNILILSPLHQSDLRYTGHTTSCMYARFISIHTLFSFTISFFLSLPPTSNFSRISSKVSQFEIKKLINYTKKLHWKKKKINGNVLISQMKIYVLAFHMMHNKFSHTNEWYNRWGLPTRPRDWRILMRIV